MTEKQVMQMIKNMQRDLKYVPTGTAREVSENLELIKEYIKENITK